MFLRYCSADCKEFQWDLPGGQAMDFKIINLLQIDTSIFCKSFWIPECKKSQQYLGLLSAVPSKSVNFRSSFATA
jgi:hypothetical protein